MPLLTLRRSFVSDHFHDLPGFQEARHGHNWEIEATVPVEDDDREAALDRALSEWIARVDYALLNDQPPLAGANPTTEALAHWAFNHLEDRGLEPRQVKIREKANYWAACHR